MVRNYRLRFILLIVLSALMLTAPVQGAPGTFDKIAPTDAATGQPLLSTLFWSDSENAVRYEYCYDTSADDTCEGTWTSAGTASLPLMDLTYNTTYYWQVRAIDAEGEMTYADDGAWWSFTTQNPALAVDKTLTAQSATPIALGTVLTYTITASNVGDMALANVVVGDPLLAPVGGTTPCATLMVEAACTLMGVYTVTQTDVEAGMIVNTGSAVSDEVAVAATDTVTTSIPQHPALAVDKTLTAQSATPIALGTVLTYTVTASNVGDVTLANVVVGDPLLTPVGGTTPCATLTVGAACTLVGVYTVTQTYVDAGMIVNTGSAVSDEVTVAATDTVTTSIPQHPALAVDKTLTAQSATPIALGTVLTYTVTASNVGDVTLANVVISDPLLTPSGAGYSPVTPGATCVFTGSYQVQESDFVAGEIVNTATATADDLNGDPLTPVTDTVTTPLIAAPPVANPDMSLGNPIGQAVTVDVLANDARGDLPIDPTTVVIVGAPGGGTFLEVQGEGYWLVNSTTGTIIFVPTTGFTGDPTPITYTVNDIQGNTSNAAMVTVIYTPPPEANDDASLGNPVDSAVTVDVLLNDEAAAGRTLDPASVQIVGADTGSGGRILTVSGEGVWMVDTDSGGISFTPAVGFGGNPTAIQYTVSDDQGNTSNPATVVVSYTDNPLARNDISLGNPVGSAVTVNILANDAAAPGRTLAPTSVQISGTTNAGDSLVVAGQGVWSVYTTTGAITFTPEVGFAGNPTEIQYVVADDQGNTSNPTTVTVTYTEPPMANDDQSLGNPVGSAVTVAVLANDVVGSRLLDPASVQISGTTNPGDSLVIVGQGTWSVNTTTGAITFTPEVSLTDNPTPIWYTVADDQGNISNPATVTITYTDKGFPVYLPLVVSDWPPIPTVPMLNVIDNPNGYGDYTVSWSSSEKATSYRLQESHDSGFSDAVQVYSDTNTFVSLSDRGPTRYYYRVQARNAYGDSDWSNVQSVDVLWEQEPNDTALAQANGPLISGLTYYGRFSSGEDRQDYYFIDLQSAQSVELWLSDIAAGQDYDLTLRNTALQVVGHSGELGNANEHIWTGTLPAGWYYIQVYNRSSGGSTQAYHLRVVYPATLRAIAKTDASAATTHRRLPLDE